MRPVTLEFCGLHSYSEACRIDFTELGRHGIFGIFGPTGSGKSTILDAVTLALFGWIHRAPWGTTGSGNISCKKAWVFFEFACGDRQYRVERRYKIQENNGSLLSEKSVLYGTSDGDGFDDVLADKLEDVNSRISELIGLSREDFTLAVLLPQGEFAKFLKASARERNSAFERLFRLERFGDVFARKLRLLKQRWTDKANEFAGAISTYASTTSDRLEEEERELTTATAEREKLAEDYKALSEQIYVLTSLASLYDECDELAEKRRGLIEESHRIEEDRARVNRAKKALGMNDLVSEYDRITSTSLPKMTDALGDSAKRMESAQEKLGAAKQSWSDFSSDYQQRSDELVSKLALFRENIGTVEELEQLRKRLRELHEELTIAKDERSHQLEKQHKLKESRKEQQEALNELNRKIALLRKQTEFLDKARTLKSRLEAIGRQREQFELESRHLAGLVSETEDNTGELNRLLKKIGYPVDEAEPHLRIAAEIDELSAKKNNHVNQLRRVEFSESASILASEMKSGMPCPVCGSIEHPSLAEPPGDDTAMLKQSIASLEKKLLQLSECRGNIQQKCENIKRQSLKIHEEQSRIAKKTVELADELDDWRKSAGKDEVVFIQQWDDASNALQILSKKDTDKSNEEENIRELNDQLERIATSINDIAGRIGTCEAILQSDEPRVLELSRKVQAIFGDSSPQAELERVTQVKKALDQRAKELETAFNKSLHEHGELDKAHAVAEQKHSALKERHEYLEVELGKKCALLGFSNIGEVKQALLSADEISRMEESCKTFEDEMLSTAYRQSTLSKKIEGTTDPREQLQSIRESHKLKKELLDQTIMKIGELDGNVNTLKNDLLKKANLEKEASHIEKKLGLLSDIESLTRGKALVNYIGEFHLQNITSHASVLLLELTRQRYRLVTEQVKNSLEIYLTDEWAGAARRNVNSLSGGETFLASFALALALSEQVQSPSSAGVECLFLDEGFGYLDEESLGVVFGAIERFRMTNRMIGLITHVAGVKERIPIFLEVTPPTPAGGSSKAVIMHLF